MKVAHRDDYDTHAVIGGNSVKEFGIAQTAEFFTVLSNTLYTNKPLAVVREVLCNGWDAHIVSGRRDIPVEIELTDEKLSFRDRGYGIHPDNMHQIYCVYGASTKENDGNQTGGFGLGSKAPFAYSDHFTVTTHHAGTKTVYAISRGSAATKGKPDIRVMVQVPTSEEGIEVMIPLKNRYDGNTFEKYIRQVASYGDMNVTLNGEPIKGIGIDRAEEGVYLTKEDFTNSYESLFVRYGNVVYPIPPSSEYITVYTKTEELVKGLKASVRDHTNERYRLILQAPPHSISVSPSRESLSLTETTTDTILRLLTEVHAAMDYNNPANTDKYIGAIYQQMFDWYVDKGQLDSLLTPTGRFEEFFTAHPQMGGRFPNLILSPQGVMTHRLTTREKNTDQEQYQLTLRIIRYLNQRTDLQRKHLIRKLHHQMVVLKKSVQMAGHVMVEEAYRGVARRLALNRLAAKNLLLHIPSHNRHDQDSFINPLTHQPNIMNIMQLVNPKVILSYSRKAFLEDFEDRDPGFKLVYIVPRSKTGHSDAIAFFKKMDFEVVDFATDNEAERVASLGSMTYAPMPRKPTRTGLILLSELTKKGHFDKTRHIKYKDSMPYSTDFEYVIRPADLSGHDWNKRFFWWGDDNGADICRLFGHKIGIAVSSKQQERYLQKEGKKEAHEFILSSVLNEVLSNPRIRNYFELSDDYGKVPDNLITLLKLGDLSPIIRKACGLGEAITIDDRAYITLFQQMKNMIYRHSSNQLHKSFLEAGTLIESWKKESDTRQNCLNLTRKPGLTLLNLKEMLEIYRYAKSEQNFDRTTFIEISLTNALKL